MSFKKKRKQSKCNLLGTGMCPECPECNSEPNTIYTGCKKCMDCVENDNNLRGEVDYKKYEDKYSECRTKKPQHTIRLKKKKQSKKEDNEKIIPEITYKLHTIKKELKKQENTK